MTDTSPAAGRPDPDPARFVADADVLAADLLLGGNARAALDIPRSHEWVTLVASEPLLDDAQAVIEDLSDPALGDAWRDRMTDLATIVAHHEGDHPGLASAQAGKAPHLLTFDADLSSPQANVALQGRLDLSIRTPGAFVSLFDPASMYDVVVGGTYPGPDRDPRE